MAGILSRGLDQGEQETDPGWEGEGGEGEDGGIDEEREGTQVVRSEG